MGICNGVATERRRRVIVRNPGRNLGEPGDRRIVDMEPRERRCRGSGIGDMVQAGTCQVTVLSCALSIICNPGLEDVKCRQRSL